MNYITYRALITTTNNVINDYSFVSNDITVRQARQYAPAISFLQIILRISSGLRT